MTIEALMQDDPVDRLTAARERRERDMALYFGARHARQPDVALGHLTRVLADFPDEIGLLLDQAETLLDLGRLDDAEDACRRVLASAPTERRALIAMIRSARRREDRALLEERIAAAMVALPDDAELCIERAELRLAQGRTEDAEADCRAALARAPDDRRAWLTLFYAGRGRVPPAEELARIDAVIALSEPDPGLSLDRADALIRMGRIAEAEAAFHAALALQPGDRRALLGLFHAGRGRIQPQEELARIETVLALAPDDPALRLDRADTLIRLGRAEAAEAEAEAILATNPADGRALTVLVQAARVRRDPRLLLTRAEAAQAALPEHPDFGWDRATALVELGRAAEAKRVMEDLARNGTVDAETSMRLGRLARATGDRRAALGHFAQALVLAPEHRDALFDVCAEQTALGDFADALVSADRLAAIAGMSVAANMCRGFIARQQGDRAGALVWFRAALAAEPEHHGAALNAAAELAELGQWAEAEAVAQRVLERAAGGPGTMLQARLRLGHVAQLKSDGPAALHHLRAAVALAPRDPDALLLLAAGARDQGLFDEAEAALATLSEVRPDALQTQLARGHLARRRGRREEALACFAAAHAAHPREAAPLSEMALEQRALNRPADADASLRAALEADPANVDAAMRLAEQHFMAERHDDCIALCAALRARLPHLAPAWLVESRAVGDRDGAAAALALLDDALAVIGPNPELQARRIDLLRDAGDYPAIAALSADPAIRATRHPGLWASMVRALLRFAEIAEIEDWLARAPRGSIGAAAEAEEFRGALFEAGWRFPEALAHYRHVVRVDPNRHSIEQDIARVSLVELEVENARAALDRYVRLCAGDRSLRGESTKASQTHVGQLLDEYRLDSETVEALLAIKRAPRTDQLAAIRALIAENPHSTAAACALLVGLRVAGQIGAPPAPPEPPPGRTLVSIPRRITQFWAQTEPPPDVQALMATWRDRHPDYVYTAFNEQTAEAWLSRRHAPAVSTAFRRATQRAQKADLLRLAVLSVEGGLYADADDRCLASFDDLLAPGTNFVAYQEDYGTLGNNVLACTPRHPAIVRALFLAVEAVNRGDNDLLWLSTGPGLLSRAVAQTLSGVPPRRTMLLDRAHILDRRGLGRFMAMHCQVTYKTTEAHWLQNLMK
jgi:tetratricopeptide (TPR) repeat protein